MIFIAYYFIMSRIATNPRINKLTGRPLSGAGELADWQAGFDAAAADARKTREAFNGRSLAFMAGWIDGAATRVRNGSPIVNKTHMAKYI